MGLPVPYYTSKRDAAQSLPCMASFIARDKCADGLRRLFSMLRQQPDDR